MPRHVSVEEAHEMCDHIEQDVKTRLPNASVVIHVEPCVEKECPRCLVVSCKERPCAQLDSKTSVARRKR